MSLSSYIEEHKGYWGPEFAALAGVESTPAHDEIAAMGCYTMMYHIADNFEGGQHREAILRLCGAAK